MPLKGMHPPARVEATQRWISPHSSDSDSGSGDSNVAVISAPRECQHTADKLREWQAKAETERLRLSLLPGGPRFLLAPPSPPTMYVPPISTTALENVMYLPMPPVVPRWTPLPAVLQTVPKIPLQARPYEPWPRVVVPSDVNPGQIRPYGRWLPVIDEYDDSDIGNGPLLQTHPYDSWSTTAEVSGNSDIGDGPLLQTRGLRRF